MQQAEDLAKSFSFVIPKPKPANTVDVVQQFQEKRKHKEHLETLYVQQYGKANRLASQLEEEIEISMSKLNDLSAQIEAASNELKILEPQPVKTTSIGIVTNPEQSAVIQYSLNSQLSEFCGHLTNPPKALRACSEDPTTNEWANQLSNIGVQLQYTVSVLLEKLAGNVADVKAGDDPVVFLMPELKKVILSVEKKHLL